METGEGIGIRLKQFREALGKNPTQFSTEIGVPRTTLLGWEGGKSVPIETLAKLTSAFPDLNSDWFLTGFGPMFSNKTDTVSDLKTDTVSVLLGQEPMRNHCGEGVPYYDVDAMAHISTVLEAAEVAPEYFVDFRPFNDCTAYLPVYGDSMFPMIQSGEIIAVKRVNNLEVLLWGEPYLIVTSADANELRTVKLVHQHDDPGMIILRASNPNYKGDTAIKKESILALYIVKGKISRRQL